MKRTILCICEGSSWHLHYLEDTHRIETLTGETSHFGGKRHVSILGPIKMPIARKRLGGFRESRYVRYQLKCAFLETWPVIIWSEITTPIRRVKSPSETHLFSGQKSHLFAATWAAPEEQRPKNSSFKNKSLIVRNLKTPKFQRIQYLYMISYIYICMCLCTYIYTHIYVCICKYIYTHWVVPSQDASDHHRLVPASTTRASTLEETDFHRPWTYRGSNAPYELSLENPAFVVWPETQLERKTYLLIFVVAKKNQRVLRSFNVQKTSSYNRQSKKFTKGLAELSPCICFYI